jgi:hypothetical protein
MTDTAPNADLQAEIDAEFEIYAEIQAEIEEAVRLGDAIRRLPDTVLEEAIYAALGVAIKQRRDGVTNVASALGSSDVDTATNADRFVRLIAEHLPAEIMQAVRPRWEEKFLEGLAEGVRRFVASEHESMVAASRSGLLAHLDLAADPIPAAS